MAAPPRRLARTTLVAPVHGREVHDHGSDSAQIVRQPRTTVEHDHGRLLSHVPQHLQCDCAPSVIDAKPYVSIEVTAGNLPVSLRLRIGITGGQAVRDSSGQPRTA
ncbi:hypothetical protein GCM10017771_68510 [Streptomyces capitiformicae]|uniref:Uncharacterized protein n=1 Tax=Streptomyces capitiformicae TaxID=2014920 RepID=A0A918ZDJ0_9ACTN|nr:hypothetical protein GCM10017771_68510 [Streptomyces capitiformicae]